MKAKLMEIVENITKIGKDDPRRIVHSIKVAIALTLNSLFFYYNPIYDGFGQSGIWAVLTVVVVFEFSVGATLSKSLNRGFATLVGGAMGVGAKYLADISGHKAEPILLGLFVFILAAILTFLRFFPRIKKKYDYGVMIFILTFSLVTVSGYRADEIIQFAHRRLSTVVIGGVTCMLISILIFPAWAGEDLHFLIATNIGNIATSLEGFGSAYFSIPEGNEEKTLFPQDHKSALNSKASEESMANFAWWEIGHGEFRFRHPWNQYLKIGGLARECASHFEALCAYLNTHQIPSNIKSRIQDPCTRACLECSKALKELSLAIKTMKHPSSPSIQTHLQNSRNSINDLQAPLQNTPSLSPSLSSSSSSLSSSSSTDQIILEIIPCVVVTSILIDIINCVENVSKSVDELSKKAHFKAPKEINKFSSSSSSIEDQQQQLKIFNRGIVIQINDEEIIEGEFATIAIDTTHHDDDQDSHPKNSG